eukprot:6189489-Pleurochrysis_carterae.AAC.1
MPPRSLIARCAGRSGRWHGARRERRRSLLRRAGDRGAEPIGSTAAARTARQAEKSELTLWHCASWRGCAKIF